jgi:hypothetical protein
MMSGGPAIGDALDLISGIVDPRIDYAPDNDVEAQWRATIKAGLAAGNMTADVVEAYAGLHLRDEKGRPITPAAHHRLWLPFLCDDRIPFLLIMAPPEAAKTTWVISAWAACRVGFFPEEPIIVCSETGPTARKRVTSVRNQVITPSWQTTFRNVRQTVGMAWHLEEWSVSPNGIPFQGRIHATMSAFGVDGSVTGSRGRVIICDDVVSRKNAKTTQRRTDVKEYISSTLFPRLQSEERARVVVIGTPYNPDDVYADFRDSGQFVIVRTPALGAGAEYHATVEYPDDWDYEMVGETPSRTVDFDELERVA